MKLALVVTLGLVPALTAQERLRTIAPELLGRAYLVNESTLRMIEMARQGATVHLSGDDTLTVTTANVDSVGAEYEKRRATYAAAIRARGFARIDGEYEVELSRCPEAWRGGPILTALSQREFIVSLDEDVAGVIVEKTLVFGQGAEGDASYRSGLIGDRTFELRPFGGKGCATRLTRYQRPNVRLEHPERLTGRWEGKWDETFGVRLTITPNDSEGGYIVVYEWQEQQGGAYQSMTFPFYPSAKNAIRGGAIVITVDGDGARAVGNFMQVRRAKLKRP